MFSREIEPTNLLTSFHPGRRMVRARPWPVGEVEMVIMVIVMVLVTVMMVVMVMVMVVIILIMVHAFQTSAVEYHLSIHCLTCAKNMIVDVDFTPRAIIAAAS